MSLVSSLKRFLFFSGAFRQYDFGMLLNLSKYGSFKPPDYDLSAVTVPIAMFYGDNDWLVSGKVFILFKIFKAFY